MTRLLIACVLLSGCYSYSVRTNLPPGQTESRLGVTLVGGLIGTEASPNCPNGLAYSETHAPWWGFLVASLTIGIVVPWRAEWACAAGPVAPVVPPPPPIAPPAETAS